MKSVSVVALFSGLAAAAAQYGKAPANNSSLPIVDLGYELQQASGFNVRHGNVLTFYTNSRLTIVGHWPLLQLLEHPFCSPTSW